MEQADNVCGKVTDANVEKMRVHLLLR